MRFGQLRFVPRAKREAHAEQLMAAYKHQEREIGRLMDFVNVFPRQEYKSQPGTKQAEADRSDGKSQAPVDDQKKIGFLSFPNPTQRGSGHQARRHSPRYGEKTSSIEGWIFKAERAVGADHQTARSA